MISPMLQRDLRNPDWTQQKLSFWLDGKEYYTVTGAMINDEGIWETLGELTSMTSAQSSRLITSSKPYKIII